MFFSGATASVLLLALAQAQSAAGACTSPLVRKEWRTLSTSQKQAYISAVKCLQSKPAKTSFAGAKSRFDDFQAEHINNTDYIHFVGFFQPWHRTFVAQYESELRSACGYTGAQPYWDWSLDACDESSFVNSPVFDTVNGFGGNGPYIDSSNDTSIRLHIPGKTGGGCILNGPFVNMTVNMGPGYSTAYTPHCLTRDLAPSLAVQKLNATAVAYTLQARNYFDFDVRVEGGITVPELTYHGGGHLSVGGDLGEMGNVYSSPGDPLFYLHHANMDRLWYQWQKLDWANRKADIAGPDTQFAYPFNFFGDIPYSNVTLNYRMDFHGLMTSRNVSEVMDPQGGVLCYKYA